MKTNLTFLCTMITICRRAPLSLCSDLSICETPNTYECLLNQLKCPFKFFPVLKFDFCCRAEQRQRLGVQVPDAPERATASAGDGQPNGGLRHRATHHPVSVTDQTCFAHGKSANSRWLVRCQAKWYCRSLRIRRCSPRPPRSSASNRPAPGTQPHRPREDFPKPDLR